MSELELIQEAGELVKSSLELMQDPVVSTAAGGFLGWLKGKFTSKRAKERVEMLERMEATEETIGSLKTDLEYLLEENENVKEELRAKLAELKEAIEKARAEGATTNSAKVKGDNNITIQGATVGGNMTIGSPSSGKKG